MMENKKENSDFEIQKQIATGNVSEEKRISHGFVIGLISTFLFNAAICGLIIVIKLNAVDFAPNHNQLYSALTDGFGIPGLLTLLFYLMMIFTKNGAFDALSYSIQLVFYTIFFRDIRETKLPKTYSEYREMKRGKKHGRCRYFLIVGGLFSLIGLIFLIIFSISI